MVVMNDGDVTALDAELEVEVLLDLGALADDDVDAVDHRLGIQGIGLGEDLAAVGEAVAVGVEVVGVGLELLDLVVVGEAVAVGIGHGLECIGFG